MKDKDLLKAMSDIDDQFILEAAPSDPDEISGAKKVIPFLKRREIRTLLGTAAACFVFLIGIGIYRMNGPVKEEMTAQPENTAAVDAADRQEAGKAADSANTGSSAQAPAADTPIQEFEEPSYAPASGYAAMEEYVAADTMDADAGAAAETAEEESETETESEYN